MKRKLFIGGGLIIIILIVVLIIGLSNLGPMIKHAVNSYGPEMLKTDVRLGDVSVSLFSAKAELKDFYLGNPKGFKSPHAMTVASIQVDVDKGSLTGDTIIIDRIEVLSPKITYEKFSGTDNFQTLLNNVKKAAGAEKSSKKEAKEESGGKKILIRNFIMKDGKVTLSMSMLGDKGISTPLPDIHLKDIGQEKGGGSPSEIFKEVFAELHAKVTSPAVTGAFDKGLKALGTSVDVLGESAKKGMGAVTEKMKGLFGK